MINKNKICENVMFIVVFFIGMFSVSIAKFFGNHYSIVVAGALTLFTVLLFNILDKNIFKENKINLLLTGGLVFIEIVLFVINDVFNYTVYSTNNSKFLNFVVMGSQLYSVGLLLYYWFTIMVSFYHKDTVELIEENVEDNIEVNEEKDDFVEEEKQEIDLKEISNNTIKKDIPFMEEEN